MSDTPLDIPPETAALSEPSPVAPALNLTAAPAVAPLSPERVAALGRTAVRVWCSFTLSICLGMLLLGLWLKPSATGVETHRQLMFPPCGWYATTGLPCPTCGCTTSVSHFSHGQLIASFVTQPFGFLVALIATLLTPLCALGVVTGRWAGPSMFWLGYYWRIWVFGGLGYLLLAWLYKIAIMKFIH